MSVWVRAAVSAAAAAAAELLLLLAFFRRMGTGSRNFIGSTDFPSERSGTHLKNKSYTGSFFLAISTPNLLRRTRFQL